MSRWTLVVAVIWSSTAAASEPAQLPGAFDASGIVAMPVVTVGFLQLGHLIDTKVAKGQAAGATFSKLFFVVGTSAMIPAFYGLAKATHVPVTWGSSAIGLGLGTATGLGLLGIDVGLTAAFGIKPESTASGALALTTIVGWAVASTLFVKADPFHETRTPTTLGTASTPLLSVTF